MYKTNIITNISNSFTLEYGGFYAIWRYSCAIINDHAIIDISKQKDWSFPVYY